MRGINKVILIGNVCADPEVRYLPNGGAVANLSLATNESWTDKNTGQKQEKSEFHRIVFFGKLAEVVAQYVKKGDPLYVEGKLQTRKWQDQAGNDKYTTEIVVDGFGGQMQMLGSNGGKQGAQQNMAQQPYQQPDYHNSAPQQNAQQQQMSNNNPYAQARVGHVAQQPQHQPVMQNHPAPNNGQQLPDDFEESKIPF